MKQSLLHHSASSLWTSQIFSFSFFCLDLCFVCLLDLLHHFNLLSYSCCLIPWKQKTSEIFSPHPVQNASHRIVTHFTHLAFFADHPGLLQQNFVPTEWRACISRASYLIMVPFCGYLLSRRYDRLLLSQPFRQSIWQVSWEEESKQLVTSHLAVEFWGGRMHELWKDKEVVAGQGRSWMGISVLFLLPRWGLWVALSSSP